MRKIQFSVKNETHVPQRSEHGNPRALIEAITLLEERVENLSQRAEKLLDLVASIR